MHLKQNCKCFTEERAANGGSKSKGGSEVGQGGTACITELHEEHSLVNCVSEWVLRNQSAQDNLGGRKGEDFVS